MDDEICTLWEWAQAQGCRMAKLEVKGRTVLTRGILAAGSPVFSVPFSTLMNLDAAFSDTAYGEAYRKVSATGASERIVLTLFVAVEKIKGELSFWAPYLASLPASFTTPLWFKDEELAHLRGTKVAASLTKDRAELDQLVASWGPMLLASAATLNEDEVPIIQRAIQLESLLWARTVVQSRAFTLLLGGRHTASMVPLFDLLNHSPSARVEWITDDAKGKVEFISASGLQASAEVYNNYGQKANDELLQGYGFCLYPNPADVYYIRIGLSSQQGDSVAGLPSPESEESYSSQNRPDLLWRMGTPAEFELTLKSPLPTALLETARLCLLSDPDLYAATGIGWSSTASTSPLRISDTDFKVISNLRQMLVTSIKQLAGGSSLEEDREILFDIREQDGGNAPKDDTSLSDGAKFGVMYRLGQKEIIHATLQALSDRAASQMEVCQQVQGVQSCSSTEDIFPEALEATINYQKWLENNGVTETHVCEVVVDDVDQSYLFLRKHVVPGEVLTSVPQRLLLCTGIVQMPPHPLRELLLEMGTFDESTILKLMLLYEFGKGGDSLLAPYIKQLVNRIHVPVYSDDDIQLLQGTNLLEPLSERIQFYNEKIQPLANHHQLELSCEILTFERWLWAHAVVEKHAHRVGLDIHPRVKSSCGLGAKSPVLALAPLLSSLPSSLNGAAVEVVFEHSSGTLLLRSLCSLKAGWFLQVPEAVLDNETLILKCAAESASLDNQHDVIEVCFGSEPGDVFAELKQRLLQASGLGMVHYLKGTPQPALPLASVALCSLSSKSEFEQCGAFQLLELVQNAKLLSARAEQSWCALRGEDSGCLEHLDKYRREAKDAHSIATAAALEFVQELQSPARYRNAAASLRELFRIMLKSMAGASAKEDRELYASIQGNPIGRKIMLPLLAYQHGQKHILEAWRSWLRPVSRGKKNCSREKKKMRCINSKTNFGQ